MKLPHCERAVVAPEKIREYLLSIDHEDGGPKAAFFLRFGFAVEALDVFASALRAHACANDVTSVTLTTHGEGVVLRDHSTRRMGAGPWSARFGSWATALRRPCL